MYKVSCPYCDKPARLVTGAIIYPHRQDLYTRQFYYCQPCEAYVGTHKGTTRPLGRLANAELRKAKMKAHSAFDPIWRDGHLKRGDAYGWLAKQMGIPKKDCHIGMMDVPDCEKVVEVALSFFTKGKNLFETET